MKFGGASKVCPVCKGSIYLADPTTLFSDAHYHTACFRCRECSKHLTVKTAVLQRQELSRPLCSACHQEAIHSGTPTALTSSAASSSSGKEGSAKSDKTGDAAFSLYRRLSVAHEAVATFSKLKLQPDDLTLHWARNSVPCLGPLLLLRLLALPSEEKLWSDGEQRQDPRFCAEVNPTTRRLPALEDKCCGVCLPESHAIMLHLSSTYAPLGSRFALPDDPIQRARAHAVLNWTLCELQQGSSKEITAVLSAPLVPAMERAAALVSQLSGLADIESQWSSRLKQLEDEAREEKQSSSTAADDKSAPAPAAVEALKAEKHKQASTTQAYLVPGDDRADFRLGEQPRGLWFRMRTIDRQWLSGDRDFVCGGDEPSVADLALFSAVCEWRYLFVDSDKRNDWKGRLPRLDAWFKRITKCCGPAAEELASFSMRMKKTRKVIASLLGGSLPPFPPRRESPATRRNTGTALDLLLSSSGAAGDSADQSPEKQATPLSPTAASPPAPSESKPGGVPSLPLASSASGAVASTTTPRTPRIFFDADQVEDDGIVTPRGVWN